jgi:uncharacterized protein (TIGR02246 family)
MAHLLNSVFRRLPAAAWVVAISLAQAGCHSAKQQTNQAGVAPPADLEAINELHRRDMQASKTWDVETLASLWTDDIVSIPQDGQPLIGKEANRNSLLKLKDESRDIDIVEYNLAFNEVKVIGEWAFEWGTFSATIKSKDEGEVSRQIIPRAEARRGRVVESRAQYVQQRFRRRWRGRLFRVISRNGRAFQSAIIELH